MRTTSFILAFAFILAGPSMAGSSDQGLPGVGTFAYNGSPLANPAPPADAGGGKVSVADRLARKSPIKAPHVCTHLLRCYPGVLASRGPAQAQVQIQPPQTSFRSLFKVPDPRGEFVRLCAPHMIGRWAHPETVCGCLHDYAAATVEDADLREALLRGISETGVPTIETALGAAIEAIRDRPDLHQDRQADAAMHVRAGDERVNCGRPGADLSQSARGCSRPPVTKELYTR